MKLVMAIIKPFKLDEVRQALTELGLQGMTNPAHHTSYILRANRELKRPMEVALVIGHHPAMLMRVHGPFVADEEPIDLDTLVE